jgi:hypothetical protein
MSADGSLLPIAIRSAALGGVVILATVPVYVFVEPPWRGLVVRLAAAVVLGVSLLQLRTALVNRVAAGGASALDDARRRLWPEPGLPLRFLDLIHDVRTALRSRRHFDKVLWPRLLALAGRPLDRPPLRPGRGPSLASLDEVITAIEKQP